MPPKVITPDPNQTTAISTADAGGEDWREFTGALNWFPDQKPVYRTTTDENNNLAGSSSSAYADILGLASEAWVARTIEMSDSNTDTRGRFEFQGHVAAQLQIISAGSASVKLTIFVSDTDLNPVAYKDIVERDRKFEDQFLDLSFTDSVDDDMENLSRSPVIYVEPGQLVAGEKYYVGVSSWTGAGGSLLGTGHSDVYPDSTGLDFDGKIRYDQINISWEPV